MPFLASIGKWIVSAILVPFVYKLVAEAMRVVKDYFEDQKRKREVKAVQKEYDNAKTPEEQEIAFKKLLSLTKRDD